MLSATVLEHGDVGYFLRANVPRLERYDIAHEAWLSPVDLAQAVGTPTVAHVDDDGIYVAFGEGVYRYNLDGTGQTHLLDAPGSVSAVHTDGSLLFLAHGSGHFISINKATNTIIDAVQNVDSLVGSSISTEVNRIFARSQNADPADIHYVSYDDTGKFIGGDDSQYQRVFPDASRTWVFPGGARVVDDSGTVYATDSLSQLNSFAGPINDIDFHGLNIPIVLRGATVTAYSAGILPTGSFTLPHVAEEIFVNATDVIAFTPDATSNTGYRADVIPLASLDAPTPNQPVDPVGLPFTPDKIELASDGTVLLFSKSHQSLFRWDPTTRSYGHTIPLSGTPNIMAYSSVSNTAYVAYSSGLIKAIQLNAAQPIEAPFATLPFTVTGMATARQYLFVATGSKHHSFAPDGTLVEALSNQSHTSARFVWNDANQKLYFLRENTSPNDLQWQELNADGTTYFSEPPGGIGRQQDSPLHSSSGFTEPVRVAPDGSIVVLGSGRIHDARTLARLPDSLANTITDAAWIGGELVTIRTAAFGSEVQRWTKPSYALDKVAQATGSAHALLAISADRLLGVTLDSRGVPQFTVLDQNLELIHGPASLVSISASAIAENLPAGTVVGALSTAGGQTVTYSLAPGVGDRDNAAFTIDGNVLKTAASFDFESKARFAIRVRSADQAGGSTEQAFLISVTNVNEPPTITSAGGAPTASVSVPENSTVVTNVNATDPDMGHMLTYSISGGADAARFSINSTTGDLKFVSARDFENPTDAGNNNVYDVVVRVSDGSLSDTQTIVVTVTNAPNEPPRITSNGGNVSTSISVAESTRAVTDVDAIDPDAATTLSYTLSGPDAASFSIDSVTGVLTFISPPNFENAADAENNNVYDIVVTVSDGSLADTQTVAITVTNVNEPPVFEHDDVAYFLRPSVARLERYDIAQEAWLSPIILAQGPSTPTVAHADDDGIYVAFDKAVYRYNLDGTGQTHLVDAPSGVTAFHTDGNLLFVAYDKGFFLSFNKTTQVVVDEFLSIYTFVGSSLATEVNRIFVRTKNAAPAEIQYISYDDAGTFTGHDDTPYHGGFPNASRTWVFPGGARVVDDSGTIYATDTLLYVDSFSSVIGDIDFDGASIPIVLSGATVTAYSAGILPTGSVRLPHAADEIFVNATNVIAFTTDPASDTGYRLDIIPLADLQPPTPPQPINPVGLPYTPDKIEVASDGTVLLLSKSHQSIFRWDPTTQSYGHTMPLIGTPKDMAYSKATNTIYLAYSHGLIRKIDLGGGNRREVPFVTLPFEARLAAAGAYLFVAANDHYTFAPDGTQVDVVDALEHGSKYVWSEANQKLYFIAQRNPLDLASREINANGVAYPGETAGGIGIGRESPLHTSSGFTEPVRVAPDGSIVVLGSGRIHDAQTLARLTDSLGNTITDAAWLGGELFTIRTIAGLSQFQHWTKPSYALGKAVQTTGLAHALTAIAANRLLGITLDSQGVPQFTVLDQNLDVDFGPLSSSTIAENLPAGSIVGTLRATDPQTGQALTHSLVAGPGDDDNGSFTINGTALKAAASFNFEAKSRFTIRVRSTDQAGGSVEQTFLISVTNVNELPTITSGGGNEALNVQVLENSAAVTDVDATDPDTGSTLIYGISGGADAARFSIHPTTGALSFLSDPDFENPTDAGNNNIYDVVVSVSDGSLSDTQMIAVTVINIELEPPSITSQGGGPTASVSVAENTQAVMDVDAIDLDGAATLSYSISGTDVANFAIDSVTGVLTFISPPNFESPTDIGGNNVYDLVVSVSDGGLTDTQAVTITVTDVNEPLLANADDYETSEDVQLVVPATGVLANDGDPDAGNHTKTVVSVGGGVVWDESVHGDLPVSGTLPVLMLRAGANEIRGSTGDTADGTDDLDGFIIEVPANSELTSITVSATRTVGAIKQLDWKYFEGSTQMAIFGFIVPRNDIAVLSSFTPLGAGQFQFVQSRFLKDLAGGPFAQTNYTFTFNISGNSNIGTQITLDSGALMTMQADGGFVYDPNGAFESLAQGEEASDSFTYTVRDGEGSISTSIVTIAVQGANDAPHAVNDMAQVEPDEVLEAGSADGLLTNDVELDVADTMTVVAVNDQTEVVGNAVTLPSGALLTVRADGSYRYDPNGQFDHLADGESATDSFSYTMRDREGLTSSATVTITIGDINHAPSFTMGADQSVTDGSPAQSIDRWATNIVAGPAHEAGQVLHFVVTTDRKDLFVDQPTLDATGKLTFTPAANVEGSAQITIELKDDGGTSNGGVDKSGPQTFTIYVTKPYRWQNTIRPMDVNDDKHIVASDALDVINYLNAFGAGEILPEVEVGKPYGFLDVSGGPNGAGDGFITAGDALDIINFLNAGLGGEGESTPSPAKAPSASQFPADCIPDDLISLLALDIAEQAASRRRLRA